MGDHRASCKIEFEMHGVTKRLHLDWVNWGSLEGDGVDSRVVDFFRNAVDEAMSAYYAKAAKWEEEANRAETEKRERLELERLKKKYGG